MSPRAPPDVDEGDDEGDDAEDEGVRRLGATFELQHSGGSQGQVRVRLREKGDACSCACFRFGAHAGVPVLNR
jgi:hypothetical protein